MEHSNRIRSYFEHQEEFKLEVFYNLHPVTAFWNVRYSKVSIEL